MSISDFFPFWNKLSENERRTIENNSVPRKSAKGTVLHYGSSDCVGLFLIVSGRLRAYISSDEGKEITIYRLTSGEICLFSASCMINEINFDVSIEAETDCEFYVIPSDIYKKLMNSDADIANYTNSLMAERFSEVMWLIEQILWKSLDKRLAEFLLNETEISGDKLLRITHDRIASHIGSAREVVSRMLNYFKSSGLVSLGRGTVEIIDENGLHEIITG